jgi:hypothetical protein
MQKNMKKLIRRKVFETNSSSCHSISIADDTKQFVLDTIYPNQYGVIEVYGDDFGWEWFKHNDAVTKASYAAQQFMNNDSSLDTLCEVIKEQTGANEVKFFLEDGYVDHDSYGIIPSDKESLRNFIFNKNSWLFGGNDNSTADPTFYNVPEFRDGRIVVPEYKYELSVEGYKKTTKYIDKPSEEEITEGLDSLLQGVYLTENGTFYDDNSIFAQLVRDTSKMYRFSTYEIPVDFKNGFVFFMKDSFSEAKRIFDQDPENRKLEWGDEGYKKCREIQSSLIKDEKSGLTKKVNFYVKEI